MRYHDWHLDGYSVSDGGKSVVLHLLWDYPGQARERSNIGFSDVALYRFTHTGGAIITDIDEIPVATLISQIEGELVKWGRLQGLDGWRSSANDYKEHLEATGLKAWRIESAIGFSGFVIAREVEELASNTLEPQS